MQLSAANLLIASQQIARGATRPPADAQAQFASALAKENGVASFEPMEFHAATPAKAASPTAPASPPSGYSGSTRLGANLDIRV